MDFDFKNSSKINGLNHAWQLDADLAHDAEEKMKRKMKLKQQQEELKRSCHGVLDPTNMKYGGPEPAPSSGCDNVSFDPEFMTFNK